MATLKSALFTFFSNHFFTSKVENLLFILLGSLIGVIILFALLGSLPGGFTPVH